ncbi:MAG: lipid-transfer protein [Acidimicrobiia bacterium]|nr:lipid-transfer protein [Acidimicrobiia bacterium]
MSRGTRDVAIVATAQRPSEAATTLTSVEMLVPVLQAALASAGVERTDIDFWCHGSCDYMTGQPFSFVAAVDAIGAWPPIVESHVEADGAFALYEAWVKIQSGEADSALVFSNGRSSAGPIADVLAYQLDPYTEAPLGLDMHVLAALQARACLDAGVFDEWAMAEVAARSLRSALDNPIALVRGHADVEELLAAPTTYAPLRGHDCPPVTDGANAVVLAAGDVARSWCERPAWIRAIDHRIDTQRLGARSLTECASAAEAGRRVRVGDDKLDVAELHAPYTHDELLLRNALGIDAGSTTINPSGGALTANPLMAAGLARFAEAADRVIGGGADRALAHCASGPCLQQNLVAILEGD